MLYLNEKLVNLKGILKGICASKTKYFRISQKVSVKAFLYL